MLPWTMRDLIMLFIHLTAMIARLLGPCGMSSVVAESLLVKQYLLILNRSRQRSAGSVKISIRQEQDVNQIVNAQQNHGRRSQAVNQLEEKLNSAQHKGVSVNC